MKQFNIGDVVIRTVGSWGGCEKGDVGVVSICNERGLSLEGHGASKYNPDRFEIHEESYLPKLPTVSRFECAIVPGRDHIVLDARTNKETIRVVMHHDSQDSIVALTPETALALSSDLLRMALKMQRDAEVEDEESTCW